jgi:small GTP-binding protein
MNIPLEIRIVLIGDSAVGKTSLLHRFIDERFDAEETGTVGVGYFSVIQSISGKRTLIEIWDTAGQEKYRSLGPFYYRRAQGALVVFDVTNPLSCEHLAGWISAFTAVAGSETVIAISGNKMDLVNEEGMAEIELLALNSNYIFEQTSACTGQGVRRLFERFLEAVVQLASAKNRPIDESTRSKESSSRCPRC